MGITLRGVLQLLKVLQKKKSFFTIPVENPNKTGDLYSKYATFFGDFYVLLKTAECHQASCFLFLIPSYLYISIIC